MPSMEQNEEGSEDFDDILEHVGGFGKYQKYLALVVFPFGFYFGFLYFTQIFLTFMPDHWCHVPELENLTIDERLALSIPYIDGRYDKCLVYNVDFTKQLAQGVRTANKSWPVLACSTGWSYNLSEIRYSTIVTEMNWVCDKSVYATYAQSIYFVGAVVGCVLLGYMADKFGRIPAVITANLLGFFGGIGTVFVHNIWQFAFMRFVVGLSFDSSYVLPLILILEYVGPNYRTFITNFAFAIPFSLSACSLPWIAYYIANWRLLSIVTSVPGFFVVLIPWAIPESARWLSSKGEFDKCIKILKKIAITNGKHVSNETFEIFHKSCLKLQKEHAKKLNPNYFDVFRTPRLRRNTIILVIVWMIITLVYDGHARSVGQLGLNVFVTFTIACATELPAGLTMLYCLDRFGRRWNSFVTLFMSGFCSLVAIATSNVLYTVAFAVCGRFFINMSVNVGYQYAAELLPTVVRAQGSSFIRIAGFISTIGSVFIVYLQNISPKLPLLILGALGITGGILTLFLPETLKKLPESIEDGEEFGRDQRFWDMPCLPLNKN